MRCHQPRQRGVSLIELMVGMAIGLLAILVITQVSLVYEGQKRTTTSGSDAQVNGALALQTLLREIQPSGYGLSSGGINGCVEIRGLRNGDAKTRTWIMAPAVITDPADGTADSIRVLRSNKTTFSLPQRVYQQHRRDETRFVLDDNINIGNKVGDLMLAVPPVGSGSWCSLFSISDIPTKTVNGTLQADRYIGHTAGAGTGQLWNQDLATSIFPGKLSTDISYVDGSFLVNLGSFTDRTYSISDKSVLQIQTFDSSTGITADPTELFPNIVNLQAVYGKDTSTPRDNVADVWNATQPVTADDWSRVIALRIAIVARSAQPEKDDVTPNAPTWRPDGITPVSIRVDMNHSSDWKRYRYKIFETVVPLRNILWQS
ncbi:MAG: PilW family protein [Leptothrix sp. (in: b-proteobacteria)]